MAAIALTIAGAHLSPSQASATAAAVGCSADEVALDALDGFTSASEPISREGTPSTARSAHVGTFMSESENHAVVLMVVEHGSASNAASELGDFGEGFAAGATTADGPRPAENGWLATHARRDGVQAFLLETTVGRFNVGVGIAGSEEPTEPVEGLVGPVLMQQVDAIPAACLLDLTGTGSGSAQVSPARGLASLLIWPILIFGGVAVFRGIKNRPAEPFRVD